MTDVDAALRDIAANQLQTVIEEAAEAARRQAVDIITTRLRDLIVEAATTQRSSGPPQLEPTRCTEPDDAGLREADTEAGLEELALRLSEHQRVLEEVLERGPVVPLRFGVSYSDLDRVVSTISADADLLAREIERLDGLAEWGLTIKWGGHREAMAIPDRMNGRDYLSHRQRQGAVLERTENEAAAAASRVHQAVLPFVVDAVVQEPQGSGHGGRPTLLRASYLVAQKSVDDVRRAAGSALAAAPAELQLTGELTGPWPAYDFVDVRLTGSI